jgi:hypothetical protein
MAYKFQIGAAQMSGALVQEGAASVTSLDANSGGITEAGAISGATTVSGSGLASSGQLNSGQGNFTVSAAGDVVAAAAATIGGVLTANANVSLGNAVADVTTIASQLTASAGAFISGQVGLVVGAGGEFQVDNSGDISTSGDYSGSLVLFEEAQSGGILRGNFNPAIDNVYNLGASDKRWGSVYAETFIGNIGFDTYTYTANATIAAAVDFAIANGAGGAFQLDLPAGSDGKVVRIKRKGSNNITLSASVAGNTIADESNGQLIVLEADGAAVTCIFSGSAASGDWYII